MSIEEGNVASDIEFLSKIMEMNETLENGSEDMLRKLKSQIEGKMSSSECSFHIQLLFTNVTCLHNVVLLCPWNMYMS